MYLTEFQKELVKAIIDKKINDIESFFHNFCELTESRNQGAIHMSDFGTVQNNSKIYIAKDEDSALLKTKEFITLWIALERVDLIFSIKSPNKKYNTPIFKKNNSPFSELSSISKDYFTTEIVYTPALNKFYERNYLTNMEYEQNQERLDRKESQKLTRKIAYISISITIVVSILTAIFNYLTYSTDRNVKITNKEAFKDTIAVKIVTKPDSLKLEKDINK
ncbi:MAG: hypothetical protein NTX65_01595 [Ignavibacteriales bacterium]|nr:hypothetical protein [Ignavibacteriales bacterium]